MCGEAGRGPGFASLKDPRHTGENRCTPCSVLNLVIAAVGAACVGGLLGGRTTRGLLGAVGTFAGATLVILLRGYLVPGTPWVTHQFVPDGVLAWIGKREPDATDESRAEAAVDPGADPDALFRRIGIVTETADGADLVLDRRFEREWIDAVDDFAGTTTMLRGQIAEAAGLDPETLELVRQRESFDAYHEDRLLARWESKAACQADVAATAIMPLFDPDWGHRSFETRTELLGALRLFLQTCPTCRGSVSLAHEVVQSCCSSRDVVAATCEGCTARVFEVTVDSDRLASGMPVDTEASRSDRTESE